MDLSNFVYYTINGLNTYQSINCGCQAREGHSFLLINGNSQPRNVLNINLSCFYKEILNPVRIFHLISYGYTISEQPETPGIILVFHFTLYFRCTIVEENKLQFKQGLNNSCYSETFRFILMCNITSLDKQQSE